MIETRDGSIEDPVDLGLDLSKIEFEKVLSVGKENVNDLQVHDLEVSKIHNYILENGGIVHNGGGKI
jgi:hypothetical protein